jgi:competence protein ComEC
MKFRPRVPFAGLALGAVAGILAAEAWKIPSAWALAAVLALAIPTWRFAKTMLAVFFTAAVFFSLHTLRHFESPARALALEFSAPRTADAQGLVWDEPRQLPDEQTTFLMRAILPGEEARDAGFIRVKTTGPAPECGDLIRIRGIVSLPKPPRNPGEFDNAAWSARQGISFELRCETPEDLVVLARAQGRFAVRTAAKARAWVRAQLSRGVTFSAEEVALVESMVLGVNAETPPEMRELFQKTGTLHLLAVSGLNVAMLASIILTLLKPFSIPRNFGVAITILVLAFYALITGLSPSCTRAALMAAFLLAAPCFDRSANPYNSLAAAAFVLLAWDTNQIFSVGFQLSFAIVFIIFLVAQRIQKSIAHWANPDSFIPDALWTKAQKLRVWLWHSLASAAGVNIASWAGSLFLMAGYFHLISPSAIVANLIAVVIAFVILSLGLASVLSAAAPFIAELFNHANVLCAGGLLKIIGAFAQIPYGHVYVEVPKPEREAVCEITVLDLDEGAASHIRAGGRDWMVDTGHLRDFQRTVAPYLRSRGINALDYVLLTHGDAAHIGGSSPLLLQFAPMTWIEARPIDRSPTRRAIHLELSQKGIGRSFCATGDVWKSGPECSLRILYPPLELNRTRADDQAVVLMVEAAGRRVLMMSDAGFFTEQWLLENHPGLRADVIIKGWHDKDPMTGQDFFSRLSPKLVIVGQQSFGTPSDQTSVWADTLNAEGIAVLPQSSAGAVRIRIFGDGSISATPHLPRVPSIQLPPILNDTPR